MTKFTLIILLAAGLQVFGSSLLAQSTTYVSQQVTPGAFPLCQQHSVADLLVDPNDHPGVLIALKNLQNDLLHVTSIKATIRNVLPKGQRKVIVIIGTADKSSLLRALVDRKKINLTSLYNKRETFLVEVIDNPFDGIDQALVIAGSDKRGTIFGIYDLSREIGVSPWYWWADVPVKTKSELYVNSERLISQEPEIEYRGIFINDEEPALGRWAVEKYGGFNHQFYEKVFGLILRLKGNYLWPAMWWASFSSDDPLNPKLADEYGIVIGTTHHEPMMRAHSEWKPFNGGAWNYATNKEKLQQFWTHGIQRMNGYESIVSLGMRGDGDMAMSAQTNIDLLETIVKDQREIIANITKKPVQHTPQLWALYKEVQDYYDKGMRVPDDVTLLLCDDNWGNIRKLPALADSARSGGYGIYYHFDYVGGPRNYKWINTNPLPRVWEQMNLAYQYGATKIWLVNVGDIKPMEFPMSFFLDYAYNPKQWTESNLDDYTLRWAGEQFPEQYANDIAHLLATYGKFNGRRKPELLSPETYSIHYYREAETIVTAYDDLATKAERIYNHIPSDYRDAFFQLVLHPIKASANLHRLYHTIALNKSYALQGRAATNQTARIAWSHFKIDQDISYTYNKLIAGGKWNHMMDQTHIGYTNWQQPPKDVMPSVDSIDLPALAQMGVSIEGSDKWWPSEKKHDATLPTFESFQPKEHYIEIFNRGTIPFEYTVKSEGPINVKSPTGLIEDQSRIFLSVDWSKTKKGFTRYPITISGAGETVVVFVSVQVTESKLFMGHVESDGYVSIDASHFSTSVAEKGAAWKILEDHGKTGSGVTLYPVTTPPLGNFKVRLEYPIYLFSHGIFTIKAYCSPTINFNGGLGLRFGISIDNEPVEVIAIHDDKSLKAWEISVADNIIIKSSKHAFENAGQHTLKIWAIDPGIVLQKIVIETDISKPSYLGPPESYMQIPKTN
jgi:hypothetical protein